MEGKLLTFTEALFLLDHLVEMFQGYNELVQSSDHQGVPFFQFLLATVKPGRSDFAPLALLMKMSFSGTPDFFNASMICEWRSWLPVETRA